MTMINPKQAEELKWTPPEIFDVESVGRIYTRGYDYGEGSNGVDIEKERGGFLSGVVDFFSSLLDGIGSIIGGAIDVGVAIFSPVVEGVKNIWNGFVGMFRNVFGIGPKEELPPVLSAIEVDLEASLEPLFNQIEEALANSREAIETSKELNDNLRTDMAQEMSDMLSSLEFSNSVNAVLKAKNIEGNIEELSQGLDSVHFDLWDSQGQYNKIYRQFMDEQTGWNAQVTAILRQQEEVNSIQAEINELDRRAAEENAAAIEANMRAIKESSSYIPRFLVFEGENIYNEHWEIISGQRAVAKGTWTGEVIEEYRDNRGGYFVVVNSIPKPDGSRTLGGEGGLYSPTKLTYILDEKMEYRASWSRNAADILTPPKMQVLYEGRKAYIPYGDHFSIYIDVNTGHPLLFTKNTYTMRVKGVDANGQVQKTIRTVAWSSNAFQGHNRKRYLGLTGSQDWNEDVGGILVEITADQRFDISYPSVRVLWLS